MSTKLKLADALAQAQAEMGVARRNATNPEYGSTYADQAAVHEAVAAALAKHGISFGQSVELREGVYWAVTTLRRGSEAIEFANVICALPTQGSHRWESAATQAQRVCLARACGVQIGQDDDGNVANGRGGKRQQQQAGRPQQPAHDPQVADAATKIVNHARTITSAVELREYVSQLPALPEDHPAVQSMRRFLEQRLRTLTKQALAA